EVGVGGDLPTGEVDGLEAGAHLLDGLPSGVGAERADVLLGVEQVPQVLGTPDGQGGLLADGTADADDVLCGVGALDAVPARIGVPALLQFRSGLGLVYGTERRAAGRGVDRHGVSSV